MPAEIELRPRRDAKPWYCEVYVEGLPLLDARGNVVTLAKREVYRMQYGEPHWVYEMAKSNAGALAKDITP